LQEADTPLLKNIFLGPLSWLLYFTLVATIYISIDHVYCKYMYMVMYLLGTNSTHQMCIYKTLLWLNLLFLCLHYLFYQLHRSHSYLVSGYLLVNMQSLHPVLLRSFMSQKLYILCLSLISSIHMEVK